ncbi:PIN domain-containing protein [Candidatus Venteria ishoeyi]|uniref:type II toxin-antitoxin system VapC family toxin n=1 Tax=Candidatus Venteria ishoeyi TaxID=1899563 RepID=UPI0025A556EE|nr:PIN domain-containing protein [Candidatus Venteria ishoeyi]MDM8546831.1 PIN domain-containing protein [Candidatus Venteria ishoeyi]
MKIIVDTPIWSYALRSKKKGFEIYTQELEALIHDQKAIIIGPIRQEILSGYSDINKFEQLNRKLHYFENTPIVDSDYINAAKFSNICRSNGIQGSHIDYLICAVAHRVKSKIFTTDKDFTNYEKHIPIELYEQ